MVADLVLAELAAVAVGGAHDLDTELDVAGDLAQELGQLADRGDHAQALRRGIVRRADTGAPS